MTDKQTETDATREYAVGRELARVAVTRAMLRYGLRPDRVAAAVEIALETTDLVMARAAAEIMPSDGGLPGLDVHEAAAMLGRDVLATERLLDDAADRGLMVRLQHGAVVRYAVVGQVTP